MSFTTKTLIDAVLLRTYNVSSADADNSPRRTRILEQAQQLYDEVWNLRPWPWTLTSETITISSGSSSGAMSTTFQEHGPEGGVWQTTSVSEPHRLEEVSPQIVQELQRSSQSIAIHRVFAVYGVSDTIGTQLLQVAPCSGSTSFFSQFKKLPPTLTDEDTPASNLQQVPPSYHYTVLLPGLQAMAAKSMGNAGSADEYERLYRKGLDRMISQEARRRTSVQQLGRAGGRRAYW